MFFILSNRLLRILAIVFLVWLKESHSASAVYKIDTVAGIGRKFNGNGGPATSVLLYKQRGLWKDPNGNILIGDYDDYQQCIRKITADLSNSSTIAPSIKEPIAFTGGDATNEFYVLSDTNTPYISKIVINDSITTEIMYAGGGFNSYNVEDGVQATSAQFGSLNDGNVDFSVGLFGTSGNVFVSDTSNYRVRKIDVNGIIRTYAGTNSYWGSFINESPATSSDLGKPLGIWGDQSGNLFIANEYSYAIRKVDLNGIMTTFAGIGTSGSSGNNGAATSAKLIPQSISGTGSSQSVKLYIVDKGGSRSTIREIKRDIALNEVRISHYAVGASTGYGDDGGKATSAKFGDLIGAIHTDNDGNLYISDTNNFVIRMLNPSGLVITVIGSNSVNFAGDNGLAKLARINGPDGLWFNDSQLSLYISDNNNYRIRQIDSLGIINAVAGTGVSGTANGRATSAAMTAFLKVFSGLASNVYFTEDTGVRKFDTSTSIISNFAGTGAFSGTTADGFPASSSQLTYPYGIFAYDGNCMAVVERSKHRIRTVNSDGILFTVAGTGVDGFNGDGKIATSTTFYYPRAVWLDPDRNVFVVDYDNGRIRRIDYATRIVATIAGNGANCCGYDIGMVLATSVELGRASSLWGDTVGKLFYTLAYDGYVRMIKDGMMSNIAGGGTNAGTIMSDGMFATQSKFSTLNYITGDSNGNLFVSDTDMRRVRILTEYYYPTSQPSHQPSSQPTKQPMFRPSTRPSNQPSGQPTSQPLTRPSCQPTGQPINKPSSQPSDVPSRQPSSQPSRQPSGQPSCQPSRQPSTQPRGIPSSQPSRQPTRQPSANLTKRPTNQPTGQPSATPSLQPSCQPAIQPSCTPSLQPAVAPTSCPSIQPTTYPSRQPSCQPQSQPSSRPSVQPSTIPRAAPSTQPNVIPSRHPSNQPTNQPFDEPTGRPSRQPSEQPLGQPSGQPSIQPRGIPSSQPSRQPSGQPSVNPTKRSTNQPTRQPSATPSVQPSCQPSSQPTLQPVASPSNQPSAQPTRRPSGQPSRQPTARLSCSPSLQPAVALTSCPSKQPTTYQSGRPSSQPQPQSQPSSQPSVQPSTIPRAAPSTQPYVIPSRQPSNQPTSCPVSQPSGQPTLQPSLPLLRPSVLPSSLPSRQPVAWPSAWPSSQPSGTPSGCPISKPTCQPSGQPTLCPSGRPSSNPSSRLSHQPAECPSLRPSFQPSGTPSCCPVCRPTCLPSGQSTLCPSGTPSSNPLNLPSVVVPSLELTYTPSLIQTKTPLTPSLLPSFSPSVLPGHPSYKPTVRPTQWNEGTFITPGLNVTLDFDKAIHLTLPFGLDFSVDPMALDSQHLNFNHTSISSGMMFVLSGVLSGMSIVDVNSVKPTQGYPVSSAMSFDYSGRSVSNAGDVNGDGYDDLIIGVPYASRCFVLFGTKDGFVDMTEGFTIFGAKPNDLTGWSVSGVGDVNNDTFADILIGVPNADGDDGSAVGAAVILYGKQTGFADIDLKHILVEQGYIVRGGTSQDCLGLSVSSAGDVNGDGFDDIMIGALISNEFFCGAVYMVFGGSHVERREVSVAALNGDGFAIMGKAWSRFGFSVFGVGDVNGDGVVDFLVGSIPKRVTFGTQTSYLIYGRRSDFVSSVVGMSSTQGMVILGGGAIVGGVGDVDRDGLNDFMVGNVDVTVGGGFLYSLPKRNVEFSSRPSVAPSFAPSITPTFVTTQVPSHVPSRVPTAPTEVPSFAPTGPSWAPTIAPTQPTVSPSMVPVMEPTDYPSKSPTFLPTNKLSVHPTVTRIWKPTRYPVLQPSAAPVVVTTRNTSDYMQIMVEHGVMYRMHNNTNYLIDATADVTISGCGGASVITIIKITNCTVYIECFNVTLDTIDLSRFRQFNKLSDLLLIVRSTRGMLRRRRLAEIEDAGCTVIELGYNQLIKLQNMSIESLSENNFIFASKQVSVVSTDSVKTTALEFIVMGLLFAASFMAVIVFNFWTELRRSYLTFMYKKSDIDWIEEKETNKTFMVFVSADFSDGDDEEDDSSSDDLNGSSVYEAISSFNSDDSRVSQKNDSSRDNELASGEPSYSISYRGFSSNFSIDSFISSRTLSSHSVVESVDQSDRSNSSYSMCNVSKEKVENYNTD